MVVLLAPVMLTLLIISRRLVPLIYGEPFALAGQVLVLLLPGMTALALYLVVDSYFAGIGFPPISIYAVAGALIAKVGLNWLVVPTYGVLGAAAVTSFVYTALFLVKLLAFTRRAHVPLRNVLWPRLEDLSENVAVARAWVARGSLVRR
jgi:O-antigen/teichoic acid export membrane protein